MNVRLKLSEEPFKLANLGFNLGQRAFGGFADLLSSSSGAGARPDHPTALNRLPGLSFVRSQHSRRMSERRVCSGA